MIDFSKFDTKKLFKSKLIALFAILLTIALVVLFVSFEPSSHQEQKKSVTIKATENLVSDDEMWRASLENRIKDQKSSLDKRLSDANSELQSQIQDIQKDITSSDERGRINELSTKIDILTNEIANLKGANDPIQKTSEISQYILALENAKNSKDYKPIKTVENYIPAGSFAKAVLLSGIDASTSLTAANDPDPVLIRITDHGTLPRKFKSDLKDCHLICAAYGDLSSERVKIRLEKLSCTEIATGEIIETEVAGFVTGEDGRQGIRGEVVSTEGRLLANSFIAGTLSGLSGAFTVKDRNVSIITDSMDNIKKLTKPEWQDTMRESFAKGGASSMDMLSKYYIERAESLQPIIQIGAGRKVDVIFTEGAYFGTSEMKKALSKKRDSQIQDQTDKVLR